MAVLKETYEVETLITEGNYGEIYVAKDLTDRNKRKIIKVVPYEIGGKTNQLERMFKAECRVYQKLSSSKYSQYFAQYYEHFKMEGSGIIVLEVLGNSIHDIRLQNYSKSFCMENVKKLAFCIFQGLEFLHKSGYLHLDLHERNVLFTRPLNPVIPVKIVDYGTALSFSTRSGSRKSVKSRMDYSKCSFASLALNEGSDPVEKDDYEGLFYLVLTMLGKFRIHGSSEQIIKMKKDLYFAPPKFVENNKFLINLWQSIGSQNRLSEFNSKPVHDALKGGSVDFKARISCAEIGRYFIVE